MKKHFELYAMQKTPEVLAMPSRKMIKTLKDCLHFETSYPGKPYGPVDVSGSFFGLYKRGLLDIDTNPEKKLKPGSWYVTTKGLHFLLANSESRKVPGESILLSNIYKLQQNARLLNNSMENIKLASGQVTIE